jgi:lysophospholipase L1-like esterase
MKKYFLILFILSGVWVQAQTPPFWNEIKAFKHEDSISFPPPRSILFVGSSSFRVWKTLQQDFPDRTVINRGFGGSSFPDVIRYVDDIITPYKPRQVVLYCGDNDLAEADSITADMVMERFSELFKLIRKRLPKANIAFVSIKPSPSRQRLLPKIVQANALIKTFVQKQRRADFINIYDEMLDAQGNPRKELFVADMLHMNADGYAIWKKIIAPYLIK